MSNVVQLVLALVVGNLLFLFFYWHRLKEDYSQNEIFTSGFYFIITVLIISSASAKLVAPLLPTTLIFSPHGLWFWGGVLAYLITLTFTSRTLNMNTYEIFEASSIGFLPLLALVTLPSIFMFSASLLAFVIFFALNSRYKRFTWYKSGKIGFASLSSLGLFFFARSVAALFYPYLSTLLGRAEVVLSAVIAFLLFFTVYNRADETS